MAVHYVDNQKFLEEIIEYRNQRIFAKESGEELPPCPEYIGECFLKIAQRLSFRPNFINYAFREDMISDGIENCVQYMNNFNPEKSKNPFSYFTQIIHHAYVRRIVKEKKQMHIRYRIIQEEELKEQIKISIEDTSNHGTVRQYRNYLESHDKYAENPHTKKPKKKTNLELYMKR